MGSGATAAPAGLARMRRLSSTLTGHGHALIDSRIGWLVAGTVHGLRVARSGNAGWHARLHKLPMLSSAPGEPPTRRASMA